MGAMARKHTVARNKSYLEKSQCHLPTLRMQFDYGYHFEGVVVEKVQVSLDIADLEKSQCHLPTFKLQADYGYPLGTHADRPRFWFWITDSIVAVLNFGVLRWRR